MQILTYIITLPTLHIWYCLIFLLTDNIFLEHRLSWFFWWCLIMILHINYMWTFGLVFYTYVNYIVSLCWFMSINFTCSLSFLLFQIHYYLSIELMLPYPSPIHWMNSSLTASRYLFTSPLGWFEACITMNIVNTIIKLLVLNLSLLLVNNQLFILCCKVMLHGTVLDNLFVESI